MTCDRARGLLVAAAVDEIEAADQRELESHLGTCPACAGERQRVAALIGRLKGVEIDDPGPAYWADYNRRIRGRLDAADGTAWRGLRRYLPAMAAALLAAVAIVAVRQENGVRHGGPEDPGSAPITASSPPGSTAPSADSEVESGLEGVLTRAAISSGAATVQRVLDDMLTDDTWMLDDELSLLSAEEREALVKELTGA
jgi:anti-sigma factor RsiW